MSSMYICYVGHFLLLFWNKVRLSKLFLVKRGKRNLIEFAFKRQHNEMRANEKVIILSFCVQVH